MRTSDDFLNLVGRAQECEALDRLLSDVGGGEGRVAVLRGEAGVGKTALLDYVARRVSDWRTTRLVGVESETALAYSGLHQLCLPLLDRVDRLPGPQREALGTVFGEGVGPTPDPFLVGLATLSLLTAAADDRPLACLVDDAQWVDRTTLQVLDFVGRRLLIERIALICTARTGAGDDVLTGLAALPVHGLTQNDARSLLLANMLGPIDAAVCEQIITESRGNPLAILEFPRIWTAAGLDGRGTSSPPRSVIDRIDRRYVDRLQALPEEAQLLVLAAAAEPLGDPLLLHVAMRTLDVDQSALDAVVSEGLLSIGCRVEFAHPLIRAASYRGASAANRRRVHAALADATDAAAEPDRRAWHLAEAVVGFDDHVATALERSAGRARNRGGVAAAARFLSRAAELTSDSSRRAERAMAAVSANVEAGELDPANRFLVLAGLGPSTEEQHARIDLLTAQLAFTSRRGAEALPLLLAAANRLQALDMELARQTYLDAFASGIFAARLSGSTGLREVAQAVGAGPEPKARTPSTTELLLKSLVALEHSYAEGVPACRRAVRRLLNVTGPRSEPLRQLWQGCVMALELWDDEAAQLLSRRNVEIARDTGSMSELALALSARAPVLVLCGEFDDAAATVSECESVEEAVGISAAPYGALVLSAWLGDEAKVRELAAVALRGATRRGEGLGVAVSEYARAVLCNGASQYEEALSAACAASDAREVVAENWGLSELVEPAVRTGHVELAREAVQRLDRKAHATGTDWALGVAARSHALLREGVAAQGAFREAIERLGRTRARGECARARLLYGEWLRRDGHRVDARQELNAALESFRALGMAGFAERALRELAASGAHARSRVVETRYELTPQESQVASLARDGLSNPQIGAQLFISSRTVEWHLRKVFAKLDIGSRRQLRTALVEASS